ncbi:unnamed protein product [Moneuplotes crassus]|uniref:Uncharacterized protein n=1 Tax=Euplotes crassus TaxID=5936 RepID=A0AAD1US15_EUPCR|nr:unnamed protein product [Moneuplotes crassus]
MLLSVSSASSICSSSALSANLMFEGHSTSFEYHSSLFVNSCRSALNLPSLSSSKATWPRTYPSSMNTLGRASNVCSA